MMAAACAAPAARAVTSVDACRHLGRAMPASASRFGDSVRLPDDVDPRNPATLAGSHFVTFDQRDGRVTAVDSAGRVRWSFGRSGDGPGEIARPFSTQVLGVVGARWVASQADRVVVFDGRTFFEFTEAGELTRQWTAKALVGDGVRWSRRLRLRGEHVYLDLMRTPRTTGAATDAVGHRLFEVFASDSSSAQLVAELALPALPSAPGVGMADGLAQAKPSWDLRGDCLVLTDGHSSRLVFVDVVSTRRDTVDIGLPEWFIDVGLANQETQGLVQGGRQMPEPTARARIAALTLSADGTLWLRPAAQQARLASGQVAWRYHLQTGMLTEDTVAAFPRIADEVGGAYGLSSTEDGHTLLQRIVVSKKP